MVAGAESVVELGSRLHQPVSRSRSGALERAQPQSDVAAGGNAAGGDRDSAPAELMLHSRINYAYRRQQEYLRGGSDVGAATCRRAAAAAGGVFLG